MPIARPLLKYGRLKKVGQILQHNRPDATFFIKILKESNKLNQYFKDFKKNFRNSDFLTTEEKNRKHMNYFRVI